MRVVGPCVGSNAQKKRTPLIDAASKNYTECVQLLLNRGANIDAQDKVRFMGLSVFFDESMFLIKAESMFLYACIGKI